MAFLASLGREPRDRRRRASNSERPCARDACVARGQCGRACARNARLRVQALHGFAGRGLLDSAAVGRARLRRLLKAGEGYVAQKRIAKPCMEVDGTRLWTDLRVWAYRGEIFLVSGRASKRPDRLDLAPPGGWLPTYASLWRRCATSRPVPLISGDQLAAPLASKPSLALFLQLVPPIVADQQHRRHSRRGVQHASPSRDRL